VWEASKLYSYASFYVGISIFFAKAVFRDDRTMVTLQLSDEEWIGQKKMHFYYRS